MLIEQIIADEENGDLYNLMLERTRESVKIYVKVKS